MTEKEREVIEGAANLWDELQRMYDTQDEYVGRPVPSLPRDRFEAYIECLVAAAKELLEYPSTEEKAK